VTGSVDDRDLPQLCTAAAEILDAATPEFLSGMGAPRSIEKGGNDFATEMDLILERRLTTELTAATGIGVHGEEFGGDDPGTGLRWLVDPIDGTFNYSQGLPLAAMLVALVSDGVPVIGLTWLPATGQRFAAVRGGPLLIGGRTAPSLTPTTLDGGAVGYVSFQASARGRFPGPQRTRIQTELVRRHARVRIHGSTGADMAFVAGGQLNGAVSYGRNAWDHAAGVVLVRAAGGVATDLFGRPWTVGMPSMLAGDPGVHAELMEIIDAGDWPERPEPTGDGEVPETSGAGTNNPDSRKGRE